jgi:hypothetical protein
VTPIRHVIRALHDGEWELADRFDRLPARHRDDAELARSGPELATWSRDHVAGLARVARGYDLALDPEPSEPGRLAALGSKTESLLADVAEDPGLRVLAELRELYLLAAANAVDWDLLDQAARALRDDDLRDLTSTCRPHTLHQMRWASAQLAHRAPSVLAGA